MLQRMSENDKLSYIHISNWLEQRTGLHFSASKQASFLCRLYTLCKKLNLKDLHQLSKHLEQDLHPGLELELIDVATTNHTYFYREEEVCNYFRDKLVPNLHLHNDHLRVWCAACSTGEEPYTLAMLVMDLYKSLNTVSILGTDINSSVIEHAERGLYLPSAVKLLPPKFLEEYFSKTNHGWQISQQLIDACTFRRLNLMSKSITFKRPFHIICCRNVLYYFKPSDQEQILQKLYELTYPGGFLLTSVTESIRDLCVNWKPIIPGVYTK